ncbi:MAG: TIM-barrel domain-containing protein, partial [Pseudomonadota bacterium]
MSTMIEGPRVAERPLARRRHLTALVLAALLALAWPARADEPSYRLDGAALTIERGDVSVVLTALDEDAIEVAYTRDGLHQPPSYALIDGPGAGDPTLTRTAGELHFDAGELTARIALQPFAVSFWRRGRQLLAEESGFFAYETLRGFRFRLTPDEKLLGGGQRVLGMDRRGHRLALDNKPHYGYETESTQMYYSLPAVLSSNKYLLLFDNAARGHMDLGATYPGVLQFEAVAGRTAYVVVGGDTYPRIIENYTAVTGRQPLPPRWALGNFASRFGYRSEAQARATVRRFREADIPLDAIVLDLYWFGADVFNHMGTLDWDRENFPTAEDMMADFAADGVRTILITEPFILSTSARWDDALANDALAENPGGGVRRFDFYFGNTGLLDVFDERAAAWYWDIHAKHMDSGVAGWWGDLGEPEVHPADTIHAAGTADEIHNAYGHVWARLFYENMRARDPDTRPFIMMRAGFAGSQRYGMIPW